MITCRHPDHDNKKLICGYPLPCPYHTVVVNLGTDPPTVVIPLTSDAMRPATRRRVSQVVSGLIQIGDGNSMVVKGKRRR